MNLLELRKKLKKTQAQVASDIKITRRAYSSYENGEREPSLATLCKLADFFEVSVDELLGRVPEQELFEDARIEQFEVLELYKKLTPHQKELILERMHGFIDGNNEWNQNFNSPVVEYFFNSNRNQTEK